MKAHLKFNSLIAALLVQSLAAFAPAQSPTPGEMKWDFALESPAVSCPALGTNGLVYFGTENGAVRALHAQTGQLRWERHFLIQISSVTVGPDGTVYAGTGRTLLALDGTTGADRWTVGLGAEVLSASVDADTVFVSAGDVLALNAADGAEKWRAYVAATTPLALSPDGKIYLGASGALTLALDARTGNLLWSFLGPSSAPAIGLDGTVYVGTINDATLFALDGATGEKHWEFSTSWNVASSPVIGSDGTVFVNAHQNIYALDGATGETRWGFSSTAWSSGPSAVTADGTLYVGALGALFAFEASSGEIRWTFPQGGSVFLSPNVGPDGTVYVATSGPGAKIYAVHGTAGLADSPWPKFQQNSQNTGRWKASSVPRITKHPQSRSLPIGSSVSFHFFAPVERPLSVQWRHNGQPIAGATNDSLALTDLQFADAGAYSVVISNRHDTATSDDAVLSVGYTLFVRSTGRGEVERDLDLPLYPSNAVVHLTALPQPGRSFLGWTGAISGTANPVTLELRSNAQVTAMFEVALGDIKWHSDFGDAPALGTNGQLYAFSEGFVVSLDAADGQTVFKGSYFDSWWAPGAIGADGTLYIGNYSGSSVWAHDGSSGEQYWGFNVGICVHACPAIGVDGTLYLAGANLYAVDPVTHLQKWSFVGGDIFESSPALGADGILYAGCYDGKMYALNAHTGEMLWEFATGGAIHSSPALGSDGSVCFGSRDGNVYSVDGATGQKRWEFPTGDAVEASPVIGPDGCVYISSTDSNVYALEGHTGVKRWWTAGDGSSTAALAADGTLYVGRSALSSRNGELLWELAAGGGTPTIGPDGTVYSGGYALHGTSPLADGPWPKFHRTLDNCGRAPARPILDGMRSRMTNEGFELTVHCERGDVVAIDYTSNLQNWTWLRSLTNTTGTLRFLDPDAAADGQRFYRVATTNRGTRPPGVVE